jgi:hypothetical protein
MLSIKLLAVGVRHDSMADRWRDAMASFDPARGWPAAGAILAALAITEIVLRLTVPRTACATVEATGWFATDRLGEVTRTVVDRMVRLGFMDRIDVSHPGAKSLQVAVDDPHTPAAVITSSEHPPNPATPSDADSPNTPPRRLEVRLFFRSTGIRADVRVETAPDRQQDPAAGPAARHIAMCVLGRRRILAAAPLAVLPLRSALFAFHLGSMAAFPVMVGPAAYGNGAAAVTWAVYAAAAAGTAIGVASIVTDVRRCRSWSWERLEPAVYGTILAAVAIAALLGLAQPPIGR